MKGIINPQGCEQKPEQNVTSIISSMKRLSFEKIPGSNT